MIRTLVLLIVLFGSCAPRTRLKPGWVISSPECLRWEIVLIEGIDMQTGEPRTLQVVQCAERKKEPPS